MYKVILIVLSSLFVKFRFLGQECIQLNEYQKKELISSIQWSISEYYLFKDKSESMNIELNELVEIGRYDSVNCVDNFIQLITSDLQNISRDKHFKIHYRSKSFSLINSDTVISKKQLAELKILDGNIGYIKFDEFVRAKKAEIKQTFKPLTKTNGIIVDLRNNEGGSARTARVILSFFVKGRVEIGTMIYANGKTEKVNTLNCIKGGSLSSVPMVILTSKNSFSAAELFSYTLKHIDRATIIGDTTGGAAHAIRHHFLNDSILISIPHIDIINPVTKSNWEGTGVIPDISCDPKDALSVGHIYVINQIIKKLRSANATKLLDYYVGILKNLEKG